MKALNVRKNDIVVVYDKIGMVSAPRAFWLLKTFGLKNVMILNGSLLKWQSETRAIEEGDVENAWKKIRSTEASKDDFNFQFDEQRVTKYEEMVHITKYNKANADGLPIIDSRLESVFAQGNIPTSKNLPFTALLNADKTFKSKEELIKIFESAGIEDPVTAQLVLSCQRGITACV